MRFFIFVYSLAATSCFAGPQFNAVSDEDLDVLVREFSAVTNHTTVSAASSMLLWQKQIGIVVGRTDSPGLNDIVLRSGSKDSIDRIPHGTFVGSLTMPHGFTGELSYLPYTGIAGGSLEQWGLALKWTFTDENLKEVPVDMAFRLKYSSLKVSFPTTVQNSSTANVAVDTHVTFENSVFGLEYVASQSRGMFEVYGGLGYLQADGDVSVEAGTIFASTSQSMAAYPYSWEILMGANVQPWPFLVFGAELIRAFDRNTFNIKIAGQF